MTHILWDWNGTLLDDTQAALDTLNAMLARRGGKPISMRFYRDNFSFPVKPFYESIGVRLANEDWDALAKEYHDTYEAMPKRLNGGAVAALELAKASGAKQSIVSALEQERLAEITERLGVAKYMEHVRGVDNLDGLGKIERARGLVAEIASRSERPPSFVLIGDSLHDKDVADAIGARCVLCAEGSHSEARLRAVAPTCATLAAAVRAALSL